MENELSALTVLFTEFYYWVTVVMMFLIFTGQGADLEFNE
jgi:Amt family ammonium transporter